MNKETNCFAMKEGNNKPLIGVLTMEDNLLTYIMFEVNNGEVDILDLSTEDDRLNNKGVAIDIEKYIDTEEQIEISAKIMTETESGRELYTSVDEIIKKEEYIEKVKEFFLKKNDSWFIKYLLRCEISKKIDYILDTIPENLAKFITKIAFRKAIDLGEPVNKMDMEESLKIANDFSKYFGFNLNVNDLIEDGTISITKDKRIGAAGTTYYDKESMSAKIEVSYANNVFFPVLLIHELSHYVNYTHTPRNYVSELLTESVAYSYEFIMLDKLLETDYREDTIRIINKLDMLLTMSSRSLDSYLALLKLKKEDRIVNEDDVNKYTDKEYFFHTFRETISHSEIRNVVESSIGYMFGIYNYIEYMKNNEFLNNIKEFDKSINTRSFEECLEIIGLNKENISEKTKENYKSFFKIKKELNLEIKNENEIKTYTR